MSDKALDYIGPTWAFRLFLTCILDANVNEVFTDVES